MTFRRLMTAGAALLALACSETAPSEPVADCPQGGVAAEGFCVWVEGIQETGFRCPEGLPTLYQRDGVDWLAAMLSPGVGQPFLCGPEGAATATVERAWKAAGGGPPPEPPTLANVYASGFCSVGDPAAREVALAATDADGVPVTEGVALADVRFEDVVAHADVDLPVTLTPEALRWAGLSKLRRLVLLMDHSGALIGERADGEIDLALAADRSDSRIVFAREMARRLPEGVELAVMSAGATATLLGEPSTNRDMHNEAWETLQFGEGGPLDLAASLTAALPTAEDAGGTGLLVVVTRSGGDLTAAAAAYAAAGVPVSVVHLQPPLGSPLHQGRDAELLALTCATGGSYHFMSTADALLEAPALPTVEASLPGTWRVRAGLAPSDQAGTWQLDGRVVVEGAQGPVSADLDLWFAHEAAEGLCPADDEPARTVRFVVENTADTPRYLVERGDLCDPYTLSDAEGALARRVVDTCTDECACIAGTPESWATAYRVLQPGETWTFEWAAQQVERCDREVFCPGFEGRGRPSRYSVADPVKVNSADGAYTLELAFERALEGAPAPGPDGVIAHQGPVDERWFSRCGATATAVVPFDLGAGDLEVRVPLD